MRRLFPTLLYLVVAGCAAEKSVQTADLSPSKIEDIKSDIEGFCALGGKFSSPLNETAQDLAIAKRFQRECSDLTRQDALDFGTGLTAYECRTRIGRLPAAAGNPAPTNPNLSDIFGQRISYDLFSDESAEPQDLQRRSANSRMPLAHITSEMSIEATFIVLANEKGQAQRFLFTDRDVKDNLKQVHNLAGAADLLSARIHGRKENRT